MSLSNTISVTAGGIDVSSLVSQLMTVERQPVNSLQLKLQSVQLQSDVIGRLKSSMATFRSAAAGIVTGGVGKLASSVSSSAVRATLSSTAQAGSISFTVDRLAAAQGLRTSSTVGAASAVVTTDTAIALSTTSAKYGLGSASVGVGVAAGKYTVSVKQATAGAVRAGTSALAGTTVINGGNNTLDVSIDGVGRTLTIANGSYSTSQLATAVQSAIDATGGGATASVDGTGRLRITTTHEGSAATLQVTGGSSLTDLRLGVDATAAAGTDGIVQIGTNAATTVTSAGTGGTAVVATGSGDLTFDLSGGLRVGDSTVAVVSTGDRTLSAVAAAINGANVGMSAAAVKKTEGEWLLQLNSKTTGVAGEMSVSSSAFSGLGGLVETSAAQDAQITVGSGGGAYSITSSSNVFSDVLPGVSLTAVTESATAVTVNVSRDDNATANAVDAFVQATNTMIAAIELQTKYDVANKSAAPLTADAGVRRLTDQIRAAITNAVGDAGTGLASSIGISVDKTGKVAFDRAKFLTAVAEDPAKVERIFGRGGTASGDAVFAGATDKTQAGSYAVEVTQAATRATTGAILVGGSVAGQRIGVRVGTTTVTYDAAAGSSAADIATGLNAAFADAGLAVNAELSGGGVSLTAAGFGSSGSFETNVDVTGAGSWVASTGTDVQGTIDGQTALGFGRRLHLTDLADSNAKGIDVDVAEGVTGSLGNVEYVPGLAARITLLADNAVADGGVLTSSSTTYESRIKSYNDRIDRYEARLVTTEANYRRQWTAVQTLLNTMQNQQSWLTQQFSKSSG
jgi:flagellar hook-associated protein 2